MAETKVKSSIDYYKTVIEGLVEDERMISENTNENRIRFILREIKPRNEFRTEMGESLREYAIKTDKSFQNSEKFRISGKELFVKKEYERALQFFSLAILKAPHVQNSDLGDYLYLAYRERSFAFYVLKDYEKSLYDINQALDICQTLEDYCHRILCLRSLQKYSKALKMITELLSENFEFKSETDLQLLQDLQQLKQILENGRQTTGDAQEITVERDCYLFVDECVDFVESEEMGRYMISIYERTKDLVILREKAQ